MDEPVFLIDRGAAEEATALIAAHGDAAVMAAALRANSSRDKGNVAHFCRWRQIERFIDRLNGDRGQATLH